jgi:hypothetical protein
LTSERTRIEALTADERPAIERLLAGCDHQPLPAKAVGTTSARVASHFADRAARWASDGKSLVLGVPGPEGLLGLGALTELSFESGIFARAMGSLPLLAALGDGELRRRAYAELIRGLIEAARARRITHLSCRIRTSDYHAAHALEAAGFFLADTTVDIAWQLDRVKIETTPGAFVVTDPYRRVVRVFMMGVTLRPAKESDLEPMKELAREAFTERTVTRFGADPTLPIERTGELYAQWLEKSFRGEFADLVMIAEDKTGPIGFQTSKLERQLSEAFGRQLVAGGIAAVYPGKESLGAGALMFCSTNKWWADRGAHLLSGRILTENIDMLRSTQVAGAQIIAAYHTFHLSLEA